MRTSLSLDFFPGQLVRTWRPGGSSAYLRCTAVPKDHSLITLPGLKRLSVGVGLIVLAAAILLLSDTASRRKARAVVEASNGNATEHPKRWKLRVLEYVNVADVEECEKGVFTGLRDAGLVEGRDFEQRVLNAQGDMATLNSLVDAALTDQADLIITLSTPTLQAAMQRARSTPIVHTFMASAIAAGVGKSDTDHKPNVTGAYGGADCYGIIEIIRKVMPNAKRIGALSTPGEVNAVYNYDLLVKAATAAGFEVETVGMNGPSEVADAALALCGRQVDLLCIPNSNLVVSAFPSIAKAARQARLPVFGFFSSITKQGALLAWSRDYYDMGRDGGTLAARVIRGESPAKIPLMPATKNRLTINLDVAKTLGIAIPEELLRSAKKQSAP